MDGNREKEEDRKKELTSKKGLGRKQEDSRKSQENRKQELRKLIRLQVSGLSQEYCIQADRPSARQ